MGDACQVAAHAKGGALPSHVRNGIATSRSTFRPVRRPTVFDVTRQCSRTGCSETAAVTLTYQYAHAQVWLDHLSPERDPHAYDLCARHAGRLTAPQGWQVLDRRAVVRPDLIAV
ncbi:MAG: DUF3499 family protein [Ilumatobacteraceae bacterium]|nr:DUF3499 family protein [Ilumatobacteraceae bacterium]